MTNEYTMMEYLVTGQGYETTDNTKQIILLHDTFFAINEKDAQQAFKSKFENSHKMLKIFSTTNLS
jgi:hypothetical protein